MADFPDFIQRSKNRIASASQFTDDITGWVFDGADGSQVALWVARADRCSKSHAHDFDEWVFVLEGRCIAILDGRRVELGPGDELLIPRGTQQAMEVRAGTRTLHAFAGKRAIRENA